MKRVVQIEADVGPDGKLTAEAVKKTLESMLDGLGLLPEERARVEREIENALTDAPIFSVSARSMIRCMERADSLLEHLPDGAIALAQAIDTPPHIFDLGSVHEKIVVARAMLQSACESLEDLAKCRSHADAPEPEKESLS